MSKLSKKNVYVETNEVSLPRAVEEEKEETNEPDTNRDIVEYMH